MATATVTSEDLDILNHQLEPVNPYQFELMVAGGVAGDISVSSGSGEETGSGSEGSDEPGAPALVRQDVHEWYEKYKISLYYLENRYISNH